MPDAATSRRLGRAAPLGLVLTLGLAASLGPSAGCKSVCQKFADHLEDCRVEYCQGRANHPVCSDRYDERDNSVAECPDVVEPIAEALLAEDCATLARQMGWEALGELPTRAPSD